MSTEPKKSEHWDAARIARLRDAYEHGRMPAVQRAFPDLTRSYLYSVVRDYVKAGPLDHRPRLKRGASVWDDPQFHQRFLKALNAYV